MSVTSENQVLEILQRLETKVDGLVTKLDGLDTKVDGLVTKVDGLDTKLDNLEKSLNDFRDETTERFMRKEIAKRYGSMCSSAF